MTDYERKELLVYNLAKDGDSFSDLIDNINSSMAFDGLSREQKDNLIDYAWIIISSGRAEG